MLKNIDLGAKQSAATSQEVAPGIQMFEAATSTSVVQDNKEMITGLGLNNLPFEQMSETFDKLRWAFRQKQSSQEPGSR